MNSNFSSFISSFKVKIVNEDLVNWPHADSTVVIDIGGERINVAAIHTARGQRSYRSSISVLSYQVEINTRTEGITALLSNIEAAPRPCDPKRPFLDAITDGRFPTFAKWVEDSEHYASIQDHEPQHFAPGRNWTNRAKRAIKLEIHNMISDYLRAADEFLAGQPSSSSLHWLEEALAQVEEQEQKAAEPAQEPAQTVASVEPAETTVEPMTAREQKMRGDLECALAYVKEAASLYLPYKLESSIVDLIESVLAGKMSGPGAGTFALTQQDLDRVSDMSEDIKIDESKFRAQVSGFRRQHYLDRAWDVPDGSSIDAECARIESMESLGQVKAYLDAYMGEGEFWLQFDEYVRGDHRPSPEEMSPDEVMKYVLEFGAMHTGNGRGFDLLSTDEASEVLTQMNEDPSYLERFTDRARVVMLARTAGVEVPAAR